MNDRRYVLTALVHEQRYAVSYDIASPSRDMPADAETDDIAAMIEVLQARQILGLGADRS